ncbi:MAG: protein kinase domain-containing protein, partial [Phycisphaerae bacterium]
MNSDIARRSHMVLSRALDLEGREREAFIASQCADDPVLRTQVARMLSAVSKSGVFLETPALQSDRSLARHVATTMPAQIGGYRVVRAIGAGGMATVYEAEQQQPRRTVALKIMRRALAHTSAQQRFRFETEVLAKLQHPGIAQIYEAGTFDESPGVSLPFFAMEYIPGATTITAYAKSHNLSIRDRLLMFLEVCDAVQHGHQLGVIHRDLKPGNILVAEGTKARRHEGTKAQRHEGTQTQNAAHASSISLRASVPPCLRASPKIIDFGVARSTDPSRSSITQDSDAGRIIGTLNYMSPEQCGGQRDIDIRTDIYSLGVVLYELMCGQLPHELSNVSVPQGLRIVQEAIPPQPGAIDSRLRGDIDAIITRAMEKDPARRYATAAALAADIRRHLRAETIEARPPTLTYRTARFVRRHRVLVSATVCVALAIIAGSVISGWFAVWAFRESRQRALAEQVALGQRDAARRESYVGNIAAAFAAAQTYEFPHVRTRLRAAPEELRGWEWHYLSATVDPGDQTIGTHDDMINALAATHDDSRLATGSRDGTVRIWSVETGTMLAQCESAAGVNVLALCFTRDGDALVGGLGDGTVRLWNAHSAEPLRILGRHKGTISTVSAGRDGVVVSASSDGVLQQFDLLQDDSCHEIASQPYTMQAAAFSISGEFLITWNANGAIWLREAANPERVVVRLEFGGRVFQAAVSPDATMLAAAGTEGGLMVWDLSSGELLHNFSTPLNTNSIRSIAFSPSSELIAAGSHRNVVVYSLSSGEVVRQHRGHEETVRGLWFAPDERKLYSASWDRTLRLWDVDTAAAWAEPIALGGHTEEVLSVAFSPDSTLIASAGRDQTIRLWDARRAETIAVLRGHKHGVASVVFSPDGDRLASGSYDSTVRIWDLFSDRRERVLAGHRDDVWAVAFTSDGARIATASQDRTARIWDAASGETILSLAGHTARVNAVAFSPDGSLLATGSRDQTVRVWDAESGTLRAVLNGHTSDIFAV